MSGSVNKVILIGHLGKDPELRTMQSGDRVCNLRLATSESWKDKNSGERKEKTEWHSITIFNDGLAGIADQYLKKGSKVYVEGQLQTRKYTDKDGVEKYTTEIVLQKFNGTLTLLDSRSDDDRGGRDDRRSDDRGGRSNDRGRDDRGRDDRGGRNDRNDRGSNSDYGRGGGRMSDMIDDDIPF